MSSSDEESQASHDSGVENESVDEGSVEEEEESVEEKPKPKKRGKGKKKKDPAKPKRNMSAFFIYSNANRARIKEENPDAGFGDIVSTTVVIFASHPLNLSFRLCFSSLRTFCVMFEFCVVCVSSL